jgi:predicted nucleotide-binding protein
MARRASPPQQPQRPVLSVEDKRRGVTRLEKRISDLESFDPQTVQKRSDPQVSALENAIDEALSAVFGHGTVEYGRYRRATSLDHGPHTMRVDSFLSGGRGRTDDSQEARQYVAEGKNEAITLLLQAVRSLKEEIDDDAATVPIKTPAIRGELSSKVFVVHGHDEGAREAVARFLEKIELEAIILREQPDQGLTIIEKFESYANQVGFAVVLLTPDDLGGPSSASSQASSARQNVIFELGYFAGKLGRGRACLLRKGEVEIPSDLYGVIYTEMDAAEGWKLQLAKELKAAGLRFNGDKVF